MSRVLRAKGFCCLLILLLLMVLKKLAKEPILSFINKKMWPFGTKRGEILNCGVKIFILG